MTSTQTVRWRSRKSARGFTLVELLVVILILSLLIAAVLPSVISQADAGEAARVGTDLTGIRDGIAIFRTNVGTFPGDLEDLVNLIEAGGPDNNLEGGNYSAAQRARWKGPYVELSLPVDGPATGTAFFTGFGGAVENDLTCFAAARDSVGNRTPPQCTTAVNADSLVYVTVMVLGLGDAGFAAVNELIDGTGDTTTTGTTGLPNPGTGRLRRRAGGADTTFYLAVPIPRR